MTGDDAPPPPGDDGGVDLHAMLTRLERLVDPRNAMQAAGAPVGAAWRSVTREEPRVQVTVAIVVAIGLMLALPSRVSNHPRWILPGLAALLLVGVFVAKSTRFERRARVLRIASLALIADAPGRRTARY